VFDDVSDAELMSLLAGGDDLALNALVSRWRERLAAFLYRMTHDRGTALDLTQETFVRLYRSRSRYQPTAAFPSYLFTIAANLARDHARWRTRHPTVPLEESTAALLADSSAGPDATAAHREEVAAVEVAIAKLPPDLREAIVLFVYEDLGYSEIAAITKCSPKAVETRIYRARQLLKQSLTDRQDRA
jgi:RNA polymerase sigma-70 factor (ECF subfamily)